MTTVYYDNRKDPEDYKNKTNAVCSKCGHLLYMHEHITTTTSPDRLAGRIEVTICRLCGCGEFSK